ncbi:hypothetical protein K1W54_04185 [Micromonospora sp. CPCC 205371]|nr:hypothetical protein [Micromonospora sp. CPCC 205371]
MTATLMARPTTGAGRARRVRPGRVVAALVSIGVGYRLYLILSGMPPTNSDEATMGLAAMHIAEGRHYPAFFYGQHYMGTLEAYLAAPLFVLFEPSSVALRLPLLPVYVVFCYVMYGLASRLYSRWFAVFVVGLLAIGSDAVIHSQISAGGGYPEIKPIGAGALLVAVWLGSGGGRTAWHRLIGYAGWGALAGLALWVDWLILPYVAAAGVVLLFGCRRQLLGWPAVVLAAGVFVGAAPSILHHLRLGVAAESLDTMLHLSGGGQASVWDRVYGGLFLGVPLGTGLCGPGTCEGWPLALGAAYPMLLLLAGGLAIAALRSAVRSADAPGLRSAGDRVARGADGRGEPIRQAGRLALVAAAALTLFAYVRSDAAGLTPTTSVRYLTPLLVSLPAVLWPLWTAAGRLRRSGSRWNPRALAGAAMVAVMAASMVAPTVALLRDAPRGQVVAREERALIDALRDLSLNRIYTEYWTCNRLAFATDEGVVCATLHDDLEPGHDRYLPYRAILEATVNPAYVLPIGSVHERAVAQRLAERGVPAEITDVAGYRIYRPTHPIR